MRTAWITLYRGYHPPDKFGDMETITEQQIRIMTATTEEMQDHCNALATEKGLTPLNDWKEGKYSAPTWEVYTRRFTSGHLVTLNITGELTILDIARHPQHPRSVGYCKACDSNHRIKAKVVSYHLAPLGLHGTISAYICLQCGHF